MASGIQGEGTVVDDSTTSVVVVRDGKEHASVILFSGKKRREPREKMGIHSKHWARRQRQNKGVKGRSHKEQQRERKENGLQHPKCL